MNAPHKTCMVELQLKKWQKGKKKKGTMHQHQQCMKINHCSLISTDCSTRFKLLYVVGLTSEIEGKISQDHFVRPPHASTLLWPTVKGFVPFPQPPNTNSLSCLLCATVTVEIHCVYEGRGVAEGWI